MVVVHSHEELAAAFAADEREISIQPWDWDEGRPFEVGEEGKGNGCYFEARGDSMVHVKGYCFVRAMGHSRVWTLSPSGCRIEALRDSTIYNVEFCRADLFENSSLDASGRTDAAHELHALHPQAVSDFRPGSQRSVPQPVPPSDGNVGGDRFLRIEPGTPIRFFSSLRIEPGTPSWFVSSWTDYRDNPVVQAAGRHNREACSELGVECGDDHCPICDHFKANPVERKEAPPVVVFDRPDEIFFDEDDVL